MLETPKVCCIGCRSKKALISYTISFTYLIVLIICAYFTHVNYENRMNPYYNEPDTFGKDFAAGVCIVSIGTSGVSFLAFSVLADEYSSEASKLVPKPEPSEEVEPPKEVTSSNLVSSYETVSEIRNPYEDSSVEV